MMEFAERIYQLLKLVPEGRVTTYKALAEALGIKAYQAVGQAIRKNPYAPKVPCHRVVKSDGTIGGFGGKITGKKIREKIKLLKKEEVGVKKNKIKNFERALFNNF